MTQTDAQREYDRARYQRRKEAEPKFYKKYAKQSVENARRRRAQMDPEWRARKAMFENSKRRAREQGLSFSLDMGDTLLPAKCMVFDTPFVFDSMWDRPTIDRIDNSKGYEPHNIWIISYRANTVKNHLNPEQLKQLITSPLLRVMESGDGVGQ